VGVRQVGRFEGLQVCRLECLRSRTYMWIEEKWNAILDSATCNRCRALHGRVFKQGKRECRVSSKKTQLCNDEILRSTSLRSQETTVSPSMSS
jgi:hypothetical protein